MVRIRICARESVCLTGSDIYSDANFFEGIQVLTPGESDSPPSPPESVSASGPIRVRWPECQWQVLHVWH